MKSRLIARLCCVTLACYAFGKNPLCAGVLSDSEKIQIVTFKTHEVLNSILDSTIASLVESGQVRRDQIEVFNPEGRLDELQSYIRTLNRRSTRLIISVSTPATQAVLAARHPSIPLVYSFVSNPDALNTGEPERNITGIVNVLDYEKGFALLKQIVPSIARVGVVYNPSEANSAFSYSQIAAQAKKQSPPLLLVAKEFSKADEISSCVATMPKVDAIYVGGDNMLVQNITLLLEQAHLRRIPVFSSDEGSVQKGAVAAYSIDYAAFGRRTAELALDVINKRSADAIEPIRYSQGRGVVNPKALAQFNLNFNYTAAGCVTRE